AFVTPRWKDAKHDDLMHTAVEKWAEEAKKVTESLGTADPFLYHNFAAPSQKPLCGYGAESVSFLKGVSRKYDPAGVFQKLASGGFKVSQAC
ncbi:hypothetical protein BDV29DRAFT_163734, partial [Aspergillus leporis]